MASVYLTLVVRGRSVMDRGISLNEILIHSIGGTTTPPYTVPLFPHQPAVLKDPERMFVAPPSAHLAELPTWTFSEITASISTIKDDDPYQIVARGNDLATLLRTTPQLKHDLVLKLFLNKIAYMFSHQALEVRAVGYRLLRLIITLDESLRALVQLKVLILIIMLLSTAKLAVTEKEQAIKLVRQFLVIENGADFLSVGVIKLLIALVEYEPDDDDIEPAVAIPDLLKQQALQVISETCLVKPALVFLLGGFRVLLAAVAEAPLPVAMNCLVLLVTTLDTKHTRKFLRNGLDFNSLFAPFHEAVDNEDEPLGRKPLAVSTVRLQRASLVAAVLFKQFNGLIALSIDGFVMIRQLVGLLAKRNHRVRLYLIDVVNDILGVKSLSWMVGLPHQPQPHPPPPPQVATAVDHYRGLVVLVLIKAGLLDRLAEIVEQEQNEANVKAARLLMAEVYRRSLQLLPVELVTQIKVPDAYTTTTSTATQPATPVTSRELKPMKQQLGQMYLAWRYNIDDNEFRIHVNNTRIVTVKEFGEWNWPLIQRLFEGPLDNPYRFDEVLDKYPKFFKRLMLFYRPFKFRFCNIARTAKNGKRYVAVGCQLFELLLSLERGRKYLAKNKILPQIAEVLAQIDPLSGIGAKDPILSKKRLETTVSAGYLEIIATMLKHQFGLRLLGQWQVFTTLHHIIDHLTTSETNNHLLAVLFRLADYSSEHLPFRVMLHRILATLNRRLVHLLLDGVVAKLLTDHADHSNQHYLVRAVTELLFHPTDALIRRKAVDLIGQYLQQGGSVAAVVELGPPVALLVPQGYHILSRLMATLIGFKYLYARGFIDTEFAKWNRAVETRDFRFLHTAETRIRDELYPSYSADDMFWKPASDEGPPECRGEFFQYLLATEDGLHYCQQHQHMFAQAVNSVMGFYTQMVADRAELNRKLADTSNEDMLTWLAEIKQLLWIIGITGLGTYGVSLLLLIAPNLVLVVHNLFYLSPSWQIRAQAFYTLGMLSASTEGMEVLDELGWVAALDAYGNLKRMCYPQECDLNSLFNVTTTNPYRDVNYYSIFNGSGTGFSLFGDDDDDAETDANNERVLTLVHGLDLVLGKIERKAHAELRRMKTTHPELFDGNTTLFLEVIKAIDKGVYNFAKRDFIMLLFDIGVVEPFLKGRKG